MSAGVTFGSVGDIISLCIVIKDLVKALDESRGSSAEYQELIRELWALDRVLLEVELLWRTCECTVELNALRETAHRMTDQCRHSIEAFLEKIKKYGRSLRDGGSGSVVRDVTLKVRWQVTHADELTKFRAEINAHCSAISMLLLTASVLNWIHQLGRELKAFMRKIFAMNVATYNAIMDMRGQLPSHLERSLFQEPFILEDGIGRIAPVHMQFITSWEAFDSVLEMRFRGMQGHQMVQNKEYVIQENATRREIGRSHPWEASFLPGPKVVMSMLFKDFPSSTSSCPKCHLSSDQPQNFDAHCAGCGMWYRRITEYNDVDPSPPVSQTSPRETHVVFGQPSFGSIMFGPALPAHLSASKKRKRENVPHDDITLFKRVRVLSKKTRFRSINQISGPFIGPATARNGFNELANQPTDLAEATLQVGKSEQPVVDLASPACRDITTVPRTEHTSTNGVSEDDTDYNDNEISITPPGADPVYVWGSGEFHFFPWGNSLSSVANKEQGDHHHIDSKDPEPSQTGLYREPCSIYGNSTEPFPGRLLGNRDDGIASLSLPWPVNFSLPLEPPLHEAISHGHIDRVMHLLDSGVDIEHHWGTTPLCRAVAKKLHVITHLLLLKGANVNADDVECWTGIMRAAENGDKKLTSLLLLHGADPERRNHLGQTALRLAAANGHDAVVGVLLAAGVDVSGAWDGQTALQMAARNKHDVVMRMLVNACAGETELLLAAANGHDAVVRLLLERGVKDASGLTPLHKAAARGQEAVVRSLLQNGADVGVEDCHGQTALQRAAAHGYESLVQLFTRGHVE
ncbi:MAG: hypothetical protein ASARMPRED_007053 [Alectoria sarmentosa]|nr:MAG: hypothetical protein ASARMPRED_007053 [Alectoria sarmentosa]